MSDIRANTISDVAGTGPITLTKQSAAKAWANIEGTTTTARDSINVSSITDTAGGRHGLNFTTSFNSSDFCASGSARGTHNGSTNLVWMQDQDISKSASKVSYIIKRGNSTSSSDNSDEHTHIHGDLA